MGITRKLLWFLLAGLGSLAVGMIAASSGEPPNAMWLIVAAASASVPDYDCYSRFIRCRVPKLDSNRAITADRMDDGRDFTPPKMSGLCLGSLRGNCQSRAAGGPSYIVGILEPALKEAPAELSQPQL